MKKFAFTLAEVLITLGVIGVVAAITMPTLIKNYQKMVFVNQLKKSVNTIENGFRLAMAKDDVTKLSDTELFKYKDDYDNFPELLKQYFNIILISGKGEDFNYKKEYCRDLNGDTCGEYVYPSSKKIYLNDGSTMFVYEQRVSLNIIIDTNGDKKPNQYGRDIFVIYVDDNAKVIPEYDSDDCNISNLGRGCYAYLLENNWKMDY